MKKVVCSGLVLAVLMSGSVLAAQSVEQAPGELAEHSTDEVVAGEHPLKMFVQENEGSPERVSSVQSSAAKRWGKVALGTVLGAVVGAAHAQLTGGDVAEEAAIGAIAGGAIAFAVTKIRDRRLASRSEIATMVAYDPAQGYRTGIQGVTVTPAAVRPGETITVTTSYWALGPDAAEAIGMSRYAGIAVSGAYLRGFTFKPDPMKFGEGGGQFETTIEVQLPQEVSPGEYSVVWLVDGYTTSADGETTFLVSG